MLPVLQEGQSLSSSTVNSSPVTVPTITGTQRVDVSYVSDNAGFENTIGYVTVADDGTLQAGQVVFQNFDGQDRGGGPLNTGDTVSLGEIDASNSPSGSLGLDFFLIQDGNSLGIDFSQGSFSFERADGSPANINDTEVPQLYFTDSGGTRTEIDVPVFHTHAQNLNPGGNAYAVGGVDDDGSHLIAMEDLGVAGRFDGDFNDAVFDVSITDVSSSSPTPPPPTMPPPAPPTTQTVDSNNVMLPDGQDVALQIQTESSTDDDTAELTGTLSLTGFLASDFNIVYIVDDSGSTSLFARDANGQLIDLNNDGSSDSIFEGEVAAITELNEQLVANGLGNADGGLIQFGTTARTVVTTQLGADQNNNGQLDVVEEFLSPSDGLTNFEDALREGIDFFENQSDVDTATNIVYFLSDGEPTTGGEFTDEVATLQDPGGIDAIINAIGVGSGTNQTTLDEIDNTGGSQIITDLSQLVAGVSSSSLDIDDILSVDISVNGVLQQTLDSSAFTDTPTGPQFGPVTLTGLDPTMVNDVDIEATLQTNDGSTFDLIISTDIIGTASSSTGMVASSSATDAII